MPLTLRGPATPAAVLFPALAIGGKGIKAYCQNASPPCNVTQCAFKEYHVLSFRRSGALGPPEETAPRAIQAGTRYLPVVSTYAHSEGSPFMQIQKDNATGRPWSRSGFLQG